MVRLWSDARVGRTILAAAILWTTVLGSACRSGLFGKVYEYEEDLYLSLDGSADLIVNASIPALVALRGLELSVDPRGFVDRTKIRAAYESPVTEVTRVSRPWRRSGRRFVQIRLKVRDVRRLSEAGPFAWSTYSLAQKADQIVFTQAVTTSELRRGTLRNVGWTGGELVAFRVHAPSRIVWHNARDLDTNETLDVERGNILGWEQHLADRLDGQPVAIEVRMDDQSILYRTLWLFAGAFGSAVLVIGGLIWLAMRKGAREAAASPGPLR
ncbi:MAG TPA: hypothetical protein VD833_20290 [Vicinamibacterales bacterium]|nr:hypothetical protein [Vicinamibacterales bacterium]